METQLNYARFNERLSELEEKTFDLMIRTDNGGLLQSLKEELGASADRKELRIAFVGQYSSGKSTIISALTGNKAIKIATDVTTDTVSFYTWNNIVLMDTPGILAGKVEQHDEKTKQALKECDLIIYVLTSHLFDDVIFDNFIDIAYNQHLADKMFIVINKMSMEDGEFEQLEHTYMESLIKIFEERGYDIRLFPIAFIDTKDYIDGADENDEDYVELSHFIPFVGQLNAFVDKNGLVRKQFDTPVRILQSYLKDISLSQVDEQLMEFYKQYGIKLNQSQRDIRRDVTDALASFDSNAMNEVVKLASLIGDEEQAVWEQKQRELDNKLTVLIDQTSSNIESIIEKNYDGLLKELSEFGQKDSFKIFEENLDHKISSPEISAQEQSNLKMQKEALNLLKGMGSEIGKLAPNVNSVLSGVSQASGSALHSAVKDVGHFFGKSFKPWQAARWASNIAKVAKFGIPVLTMGIDIWMQVRDSKKENQRLQQIKSSKNLFVTGYQSAINEVNDEFRKYLQEVIDNYNDKREEINRSKEALIKTAQQNQQLQESIDSLEAEYIDFIEIIDEN